MKQIIYDKWLTLDRCPQGEGMKAAVTPNEKRFFDQLAQTSKKIMTFGFMQEIK